MLSVDACPVCGAREFKLLCRDKVDVGRLDMSLPYERRWRKTLQSINVDSADFSVFQCRRCSHGFRTPSYTLEECKNIYNQWGREKNDKKDPVNESKKLAIEKKYINDQLERIRYFLGQKIYGMKVADVGGGDGSYLQSLSADNECYLVEKRYLDLKSEKLKNVRVFQDLEHLPSNYFSLVMLNHVVEHFSLLQESVSAIAGKLMMGGSLYVEVPCELYSAVLSRYCKRGRAASFIGWAPHLQFFTSESLVYLFSRHGLRLKIIDISFRNYWDEKFGIISALFTKVEHVDRSCRYISPLSDFFKPALVFPKVAWYLKNLYLKG